jgi:hypothetical protein
MNHPAPTIGRIVYHRAHDRVIRPAIITAVHGIFSVDLYVFPTPNDPLVCGPIATVTHADPELEPGCLNSWHWMPYQLEQAAKSDNKPAAGRPDQRVAALEAARHTHGHTGSHPVVLDAAAAYLAFLINGTLPAAAPKE